MIALGKGSYGLGICRHLAKIGMKSSRVDLTIFTTRCLRLELH